MIVLNKLPHYIVDTVARSLGADADEVATALPPEIVEHIRNMTPRQIVRIFVAWYIGYEELADDIIDAYEAAKKASE